MAGSKVDLPLNWERGDGTKGSLSLSRKGDYTEGAPGQDNPGIKHQTQTPFLESQSLYPMVQDQEDSQSKSQWGELCGSLGQWHTIQHHHSRVHQNSLSR